ncbi:hypothetical protein ACIQ9R_37440 [Streptomyces sp. NPDC094447]|uniref:hypothetical protein n=1 Tax=Streptomyces sp. NPDC094447 TaxID=3366062 RepID=UPI00381C19F8
MTDTDFTPHPGVHTPWMFICGADPDDAVVAYAEHPPAHIASVLLEDISEWHHAIQNLQKATVPPPVVEALDRLHEAVCGWVEWNEKQSKDPA